MDTKALRQKILDLAIRGKLVPQDPNDEPAEVLLERIREQKQQMLKEGKLKKKDIKNDTIIFKGEDNLHYEKFQDGTVKCIEDEIPFEVPEGWCWARVRDIAMVKGGKRLPKGASFSEEITTHAYIRVSDMKNHSVNISNLRYISDETFLAIKNYTIAKDDLYVTIAGTIGVVGEIPDKLDGMNLTENAVKITNIAINKSFLCIILQTNFVQQQFQDKTHQVAMPKLALERILSTLIPICPYVQQLQIVDRFQVCDNFLSTIDTEKEELQKIVSLSKSKILDLAIRGKLVPQDPNDEPASVLIERIRAEKEELIKQGKIKRNKKESVIFKGDDNSYYLRTESKAIEITNELPYKIPDSWEWAKIGDIFQVNPRNKIEDLLEVSFIPMPLIDDGFSGKHTSEERVWRKVKSGFTHFMEGDIGIAKITPCFENRKSVIFKNLKNGYGAGTTELHILRPYESTILPEYVLAYVKSSMFISKGKQEFTGAVGQQRIGKDYLENSYFPIPPLEEQVRIVEQISTVYKQLNMISDALV